MPTENRSANAFFQREDRYVVIKISKMHPHPTFRARHLAGLRREYEGAIVDCVVVERDWPEFEPTWAAIEARVTGKPAEQHHGDVEKLHRGHIQSLEALNQQTEKQRDHWMVECNTLRGKLVERNALLLKLIQIAEDREQGYAERKHGGVVNGKCADSLVMLLGQMKVLLSATEEPGSPLERDPYECRKCGSLTAGEYKAGGCWFERGELAAMVDAAMEEMANISPPLKRSECERLIRAAMERKP